MGAQTITSSLTRMFLWIYQLLPGAPHYTTDKIFPTYHNRTFNTAMPPINVVPCVLNQDPTGLAMLDTFNTPYKADTLSQAPKHQSLQPQLERVPVK
jgi:hypothetical protein